MPVTKQQKRKGEECQDLCNENACAKSCKRMTRSSCQLEDKLEQFAYGKNDVASLDCETQPPSQSSHAFDNNKESTGDHSVSNDCISPETVNHNDKASKGFTIVSPKRFNSGQKIENEEPYVPPKSKVNIKRSDENSDSLNIEEKTQIVLPASNEQCSVNASTRLIDKDDVKKTQNMPSLINNSLNNDKQFDIGSLHLPRCLSVPNGVSVCTSKADNVADIGGDTLSNGIDSIPLEEISNGKLLNLECCDTVCAKIAKTQDMDMNKEQKVIRHVNNVINYENCNQIKQEWVQTKNDVLSFKEKKNGQCDLKMDREHNMLHSSSVQLDFELPVTSSDTIVNEDAIGVAVNDEIRHDDYEQMTDCPTGVLDTSLHSGNKNVLIFSPAVTHAVADDEKYNSHLNNSFDNSELLLKRSTPVEEVETYLGYQGNENCRAPVPDSENNEFQQTMKKIAPEDIVNAVKPVAHHLTFDRSASHKDKAEISQAVRIPTSPDNNDNAISSHSDFAITAHSRGATVNGEVCLKGTHNNTEKIGTVKKMSCSQTPIKTLILSPERRPVFGIASQEIKEGDDDKGRTEDFTVVSIVTPRGGSCHQPFESEPSGRGLPRDDNVALKKQLRHSTFISNEEHVSQADVKACGLEISKGRDSSSCNADIPAPIIDSNMPHSLTDRSNVSRAVNEVIKPSNEKQGSESQKIEHVCDKMVDNDIDSHKENIAVDKNTSEYKKEGENSLKYQNFKGPIHFGEAVVYDDVLKSGQKKQTLFCEKYLKKSMFERTDNSNTGKTIVKNHIERGNLCVKYSNHVNNNVGKYPPLGNLASINNICENNSLHGPNHDESLETIKRKSDYNTNEMVVGNGNGSKQTMATDGLLSNAMANPKMVEKSKISSAALSRENNEFPTKCSDLSLEEKTGAFNPHEDDDDDMDMIMRTMTDSQLFQNNESSIKVDELQVYGEKEFEDRHNKSKKIIERKKEEGKNLVKIVLNELNVMNRQLLRLKREMNVTKRSLMATNDNASTNFPSTATATASGATNSFQRLKQDNKHNQQQHISTMFKG